MQQIVNETFFAAIKTVVVQRFARFRRNLGNLRISQDICYVRMTDNNDLLTTYGHCANISAVLPDSTAARSQALPLA